MSKPDPAAIVGRLIANLVPLGLMLWAGVESSGVLRWALFGWVAFAVFCFASLAAMHAEAKK